MAGSNSLEFAVCHVDHSGDTPTFSGCQIVNLTHGPEVRYGTTAGASFTLAGAAFGALAGITMAVLFQGKLKKLKRWHRSVNPLRQLTRSEKRLREVCRKIEELRKHIEKQTCMPMSTVHKKFEGPSSRSKKALKTVSDLETVYAELRDKLTLLLSELEQAGYTMYSFISDDQTMTKVRDLMDEIDMLSSDTTDSSTKYSELFDQQRKAEKASMEAFHENIRQEDERRRQAPALPTYAESLQLQVLEENPQFFVR